MKRLLLGIAALAALADVRAAPAHRSPDVTARAPASARMRVHARAPAPAAPALPPGPSSLAGTDVDGGLAVDAAGDLVLDEDVRRFLDYFLSATGEEPDAVIRARIAAAIDARLPARAARQAHELAERYVGCRDRARALSADGDLAARLAAVRDLRRGCLGDDAAAALFAEEDAEADRALAGAAPRPAQPWQREDALRAAGAGPAEIRALREAAFGPDGADRLEALDRARAAWRARLDAYRGGRATLADFSPEERVRVEALERIGAP